MQYQGNETVFEITDLLDKIFSKDMQFLSAETDKVRSEKFLRLTAKQLKDIINTYVDLKLDMCIKLLGVNNQLH